MEVDPLFRLRGVRLTDLRRRLFVALRSAGRPLSYQEIIAGLEPKVDKVTLYRNLDVLLTGRLIHRVLGLDGAFRYCANPASQCGCPGDHPHGLCLRCGRMWCFDGEPMPRVMVPEGFKVEGKQMVVFGICADCMRKDREGLSSD
ncbi:Fur family transcriptional regulator [Thermanaerovibrio acidaminovorans]|uniref:Transcription regulator protein n=1 Tax=Thermanaerovibrio acidaminovorans (strain ATCC 49978 / DSM 6589 / Su883) TaxID=525903 RepID=D1B734_THEAS|nr:Fur family transcriptional regulator [Thermanaerovibrio acidaminovorans]ACZ19825.1 putative transcription regulator protein [Thermanaerovibrio acidaminovorans DSM 6589]